MHDGKLLAYRFKISKKEIEAIEREFYLKYNNYKLNNMLSR